MNVNSVKNKGVLRVPQTVAYANAKSTVNLAFNQMGHS